MPDHQTIYQQDAERYNALVMCEDMEGNLLPAIQRILPLSGLDIVESGAGTGRLSTQLAPLVRSLRAFDLSPHMLAIATHKLEAINLGNWETGVADHRDLPVEDQSADLVISGWSVCYLNDKERADWQAPFLAGMAEFKRILRPGGKIILIETEGTGVTEPAPPPSMHRYLGLLKELGFQWSWIRTDYRFTGWEQAQALVPFFFGEAMLAACWEQSDGVILPECTGIWQRQAAI